MPDSVDPFLELLIEGATLALILGKDEALVTRFKAAAKARTEGTDDLVEETELLAILEDMLREDGERRKKW